MPYTQMFKKIKIKIKNKPTGEQIKLFMWYQMAVGKTGDICFFVFFSNVWCRGLFYFRILVLFLLLVKIMGDGILENFSGI